MEQCTYAPSLERFYFVVESHLLVNANHGVLRNVKEQHCGALFRKPARHIWIKLHRVWCARHGGLNTKACAQLCESKVVVSWPCRE